MVLSIHHWQVKLNASQGVAVKKNSQRPADFT